MSALNLYNFDSLLDEFEAHQGVEIRHRIRGALRKSFQTHPLRHHTQAEETRRFGLCYSLLLMCLDAGEPIPRVLDQLDGLLGHILDDREISISNGSAFWVDPNSGMALPIDAEEGDLNDPSIPEISDEDLDKILLRKLSYETEN